MTSSSPTAAVAMRQNHSLKRKRFLDDDSPLGLFSSFTPLQTRVSAPPDGANVNHISPTGSSLESQISPNRDGSYSASTMFSNQEQFNRVSTALVASQILQSPILARSGLANGSDADLSPEALSIFDEYAANPRFVELQEELRALLVTSANSTAPTRAVTPEVGRYDANIEPRRAVVLPASSQPANLMKSIVSDPRRIRYLRNWTLECAPWLDMFDVGRCFGIEVPIIAERSPTLLYAILALGARQMERQQGLKGVQESLELYQESIKLLTPLLEARDPEILVTACILCCLEMFSVSPRDWRRHVEGCAAMFESFNVHGFSGGLFQAVFWCYARMDLCGAIISDGSQSTTLPIDKWVIPPKTSSYTHIENDQNSQAIEAAFFEKGHLVPDMYANYSIYLCAKTCDLVSSRTRFLEANEANNCTGQIFLSRWTNLWSELQRWLLNRPPELLPLKTIPSNGKDRLFPSILFAHFAAISGNQIYHTACIMMLEIKPPEIDLLSLPSPTTRSTTTAATTNSVPSHTPLWHARRIVGISTTNPHRGCLNNAIQPLFVAGKLFSYRNEHLAVIKVVREIEEMTGWGACWRIKDLEDAWGYERDSLS